GCWRQQHYFLRFPIYRDILPEKNPSRYTERSANPSYPGTMCLLVRSVTNLVSILQKNVKDQFLNSWTSTPCERNASIKSGTVLNWCARIPTSAAPRM